MRTEYLGATNTNSDATQAERGIFFFIQMEVIRLFIRTDIQSADDNTPTLQTFYNLTIGIKKFILSRKIIAAQIEELASHQANTFGIPFEGMLHVGRVTNVCKQLNLTALLRYAFFTTVGFQLTLVLICCTLLFFHEPNDFRIRVNEVAPFKAVHNHHAAIQLSININMSFHQRGDTHNSGKNSSMAVGRTLSGDKRQDFVFRNLNRLGRRQVFRNQDTRLVHGKADFAAAQNGHDSAGNIPYIYGTSLHIGIFHGSKGSSEGIACFFYCFGSTGTVLNHGINAVQVIQIVQHHHLHIQNHGLLFAQGGSCLIYQSLKLFQGNLFGGLEIFLFFCRISAGGRKRSLSGLINVHPPHGDSGEYRMSIANDHFVISLCCGPSIILSM